ncbi:NPCBM/NEW2 domain-containing protein [Nocardiopsis suaedae]|uniref:NPCBM/NEW2 domain-containing protein n=1 Tax=Nocardiopsis suaedae TaxID=3018444 RepID=A0ABT4TE99_9ACTN|nr:NPCBM/NEW2 domain-containing protein [Nocardiopsis suaedae]MDA2803033.1 NPCBM/NEW2 domain-containing protein [Nocardiopsis suaedae]
MDGGPPKQEPGPEHHRNENTGNADKVFQARDIHGGIHLHGESRPRRRRRLVLASVLVVMAVAAVPAAYSTGLVPASPFGREGAEASGQEGGTGGTGMDTGGEPGEASPSEAAPVEAVYLEDLEDEGSGVVVSDGTASIAGTRYPKSVYYRLNAVADEKVFTYTVPEGFTAFRAVAGVSDESRLGTTMEFEVRVDGKVAAQSGDMAMQESHDFDVPVSAGSKLELVMRITTPDAGGGDRDRFATWGDARLEG